MLEWHADTSPGSAASERLYSTGKNVLGTTRLSLKAQNMEANLFLKYNVRALGYKTNFPTVAASWEAPNAGVLPDVIIDSTLVDEEESAEIVIEISDEEPW